MKSLLFTVSFIFLAWLSQAQETPVAGEDFSFRLVSTPGFIEMQSEEGCTWLTLSFSLWATADPVLVNQTGMLGSDMGKIEAHLENSIFLIKLERTENGILLKSFLGTNWDAEKVVCLDDYCSFQVTNLGVTLYQKED